MPERLVRWKIEARGEVQKVGYRDFVEGVAHQLGILGSVKNDEEDSGLVHIVAQGPETQIVLLVRDISGKHGVIHARSVQRVGEEPVDPGLRAFKQVLGSDAQETRESAVQGVKILSKMADSLDRLGALGQESLSVGKETLGIAKENLSVSKEGLAVGKETLAAVREGDQKILEAVVEGNRVLGSKIDAVVEGNRVLGSKVDAVVEGNRV
ncbi:MAG: acylphosphatase, partial [Thermoplasmata archaeon]|nr:acylphosphatase [Thermoplasmata archaeon]